MKNKMFRIIATALLALGASAAHAGVVDPFGQFNVYSLGDIGSSARPYGSDFEGAAGAGGSAHFSGFSLNLLGGEPYGLRVGGDASLRNGSYYGHVEAGGNVTLGGMNVEGDIQAGGTVQFVGGGTVSGTITQHTPAATDHAAIGQFFRNYSALVGSQAGQSAANNWGGLSFTAHSGDNYITIGGATLGNAWGFSITGPSDARVFINVLDASVSLDSTNWDYFGGLSRSNVLLNLPNATTLNLTGGNTVNILAPYANTEFSYGLVTGNLIVGNLMGGGQVNLGGFNGPAVVPEPATLATLAVAGVALLRRRQK